MISFERFQQLPVHRQAGWLSAEGTYLEMIRKEGCCSVELYALGNFYVEMYFDELTDEPQWLRAFQNSDRLEPYLDMIAIDGIFELE